MSFTPTQKEKLTSIGAIVVYLTAGLLLLIKPEIMTELTRWTLTIVLAVCAVLQAVKYFTTPPLEAARGYSLTLALMAATAAIFAAVTNEWLTYRLWGLLILCGGYHKLQTACDFRRLGHSRWWWILIGTGISLVFGILILTGFIPASVTVWFGIALLIEAVLDAAVLVMVANGDRLQAGGKPAEAPAE